MDTPIKSRLKKLARMPVKDFVELLNGKQLVVVKMIQGFLMGIDTDTDNVMFLVLTTHHLSLPEMPE